jgi:hypothetical protein
MLPDLALSALTKDVNALGPHGAKLLEELHKSGEQAFASAFMRLERDPEFARDYLPRLREMSAGAP